MKTTYSLVILLLFTPLLCFSQNYDGKILRSKDSVFVNGKYFNKNTSKKEISIGDEIRICCGGTVIIHLEKNASILEKEKSAKNVVIKIVKPGTEKNLMNKKYAAFTTLSASSRGGIFEPPLSPPNGAFAFIDEPVEFVWNKLGKSFILRDSKGKIMFKSDINNANKFEFIPKEQKIKKGQYFWNEDDSEQVEINFIK